MEDISFDEFDEQEEEVSLLDELRTHVEQYFTIRNAFQEFMPTFIVEATETKESMKALKEDVASLGLTPYLRKYASYEPLLVLSFFNRNERETGFPTKNVLLLIATIATVSLAGYLHAVALLTLRPEANLIFEIFLFVVAVMGIIGLHEMGHFFLSRWYDIDASLPYFIPSIPPFGTFGAFISLRELHLNRDELFDVGFFGPLFGFIVTIIVTLFGIMLSPFLMPETIQAIAEQGGGAFISLPEPLLFTILVNLLVSTGLLVIPTGAVLVLHPVAFAGWVGMYITALNLFPITQLDGGHVSRSLFGEKGHRYVGIVALVIVFVILAFFNIVSAIIIIMVLLFFMRARHPGPLDDVSKLSPKRIIVAILAYAILIVCMPIPEAFIEFLMNPFSFFSQLL
ncbi:MAG: site-2 protease family protein [Promethearchaeota archaeon]